MNGAPISEEEVGAFWRIENLAPLPFFPILSGHSQIIQAYGEIADHHCIEEPTNP
jgi:hypothetical protein